MPVQMVALMFFISTAEGAAFMAEYAPGRGPRPKPTAGNGAWWAECITAVAVGAGGGAVIGGVIGAAGGVTVGVGMGFGALLGGIHAFSRNCVAGPNNINQSRPGDPVMDGFDRGRWSGADSAFFGGTTGGMIAVGMGRGGPPENGGGGGGGGGGRIRRPIMPKPVPI